MMQTQNPSPSPSPSVSFPSVSFGRSASRWDRAVILEDDVVIAPNFVPVMDQLWRCLDRMEVLGVDWDVVYLGYFEPLPLDNDQLPAARRSTKFNNNAFVEESVHPAEFIV